MSKALFQVTGVGGGGIRSECKKIRKHMEHKAGWQTAWLVFRKLQRHITPKQ